MTIKIKSGDTPGHVSEMVLFADEVSDAQAAPCEYCPIYEAGRFDPVMPDPYKLPDKELMLYIVGEAPGIQEHKAEGERRKPFIGPAGQLLRKALNEVGSSHDSRRIWNLVNCLPQDEAGKTRTPSMEECRACKAFVRDDVEDKQPNAVLLLGRIAIRGFLGKQNIRLEDVRRKKYKWRGIKTIATYHPSYVLRQGGIGSNTWKIWLRDIYRAWEEAVPF